MYFQSARCELCGQYAFAEADLIAYRVRGHGKMEAVTLHGEQPWTGIRTVHKSCVAFLAQQNPPESSANTGTTA